MDTLANLALALGGAAIFLLPFLGACWVCERSEKCKKFIKRIGEKYF